MFTELTR